MISRTAMCEGKTGTRLSTKPRGFTIIELLVAIGITVALVTIMLNITTTVLSGWNRTSGKLTSGNQARLILDQLSQDLQAAIMRRDTNTWLVATVQRDQTSSKGDSGLDGDTFLARWTASSGGMVKPLAANGSFDPTAVRSTLSADDEGKLEHGRFGQAGVWLRLFTTPPDNHMDSGKTSPEVTDVSAPRAVSYQLIRTRVGGSSSTQYSYLLFRSEVRPSASDSTDKASTFGVGYDLLMSESPPDSGPSYNKANGTEQYPGNVRRPNANQIIANDVIDFGVKLYGRDSSGTEIELFPAPKNASGVAQATVPAAPPYTYAATSRDSSTAINVAGVGSTVWYGSTYGYPVAAEVMIRILTAEGARLIASLEAGQLKRPTDVPSDDEYWWQLAEQHSQVFTRRVEIKAAAL